jgi:hypothetical protein
MTMIVTAILFKEVSTIGVTPARSSINNLSLPDRAEA